MKIVRDKDSEHVAAEYDLTEEQEAQLEEAIAEIERGDWVDWDDKEEWRLRRELTPDERAELDNVSATVHSDDTLSAQETLRQLRLARENIVRRRR